MPLHAFRRTGVQEYLAWRVRDAAIDWFALRGSEYERLELNANGAIRSEVLPGLWVDGEALIRLDVRRAFDRMEEGTVTSEHAAFVAKLSSAAK